VRSTLPLTSEPSSSSIRRNNESVSDGARTAKKISDHSKAETFDLNFFEYREAVVDRSVNRRGQEPRKGSVGRLRVRI
jgi:hypothetical protein